MIIHCIHDEGKEEFEEHGPVAQLVRAGDS